MGRTSIWRDDRVYCHPGSGHIGIAPPTPPGHGYRPELRQVDGKRQIENCEIVASQKSASGRFRWISPENAVVFVVTTAGKVVLLLSPFQHKVRRVLGGLVFRHGKSKSGQVKTSKQCFSLTEYNRPKCKVQGIY